MQELTFSRAQKQHKHESNNDKLIHTARQLAIRFIYLHFQYICVPNYSNLRLVYRADWIMTGLTTRDAWMSWCHQYHGSERAIHNPSIRLSQWGPEKPDNRDPWESRKIRLTTVMGWSIQAIRYAYLVQAYQRLLHSVWPTIDHKRAINMGAVLTNQPVFLTIKDGVFMIKKTLAYFQPPVRAFPSADMTNRVRTSEPTLQF